MRDAQAAEERRVFGAFAEGSLELSPRGFDTRQPPEPDIRCYLADGTVTSFELVRIVDPALATAMNEADHLESALSSAYSEEALPGFTDALVGVMFTRKSGRRQRVNCIPRLFDYLGTLPSYFTGSRHIPIQLALREHVVLVRVYRGRFVGPMFRVDAGAVVQDPILDRVRGKFAKHYETDTPVELLAYYEHQPTVRVEFTLPRVQEFIDSSLATSPFSRVWVFDAAQNEVLLSRALGDRPD
jgi:hypothetical protein